MSDSDFDEIGFSDCESENVQNEQEDSKTVVVDLPPEMMSGNITTDAAKSSGEEASTDSSFIPVQRMGEMDLGPKGEGGKQDGSTSTWSHVCRSTTERDGDESTTAGQEQDGASLSTWVTQDTTTTRSSQITEFDLLSLNGNTRRKCKRCSFLNNETSVTCQMCSGALVANPCLDIDTQIALNLQRKEDLGALNLLRCAEKKWKQDCGKLLVSQADLLHDMLQRIAYKHHGVTVIAKQKLIAQASHFINCFVQRELDQPDHVQFAYHFSGIQGSGDFSTIEKYGFGGVVSVSSNVEAAYNSIINYTSNFGSSTLFSIAEDANATIDEAKKLCWIVATADIFNEAWSEKTMSVSSGTAMVKTYLFRNHCLPLMCFDASLRTEGIVLTLMNAVSESCRDIFAHRGDLFGDNLLGAGAVDETEEVCEGPPNKRAPQQKKGTKESLQMKQINSILKENTERNPA